MQKLIPALLFALLALVSCNKSDDDTAAKSSNWVVKLYQVPSGNIVVKEDKTSMFAGYTFEFNDDNSLVIHRPDGSVVDNAKWGVEPGSSTATLAMDNAVAPLDAIMGQWQVTEQTDTDFKLDGQLDASGTNVGEILQFQKQ